MRRTIRDLDCIYHVAAIQERAAAKAYDAGERARALLLYGAPRARIQAAFDRFTRLRVLVAQADERWAVLSIECA